MIRRGESSPRALREWIFADYLWRTYRLDDRKILAAIKRLLTQRERAGFRIHATIVSGKKLISVLECPESLKEVILIARHNPGRIRRCALTLKRKENSAQA